MGDEIGVNLPRMVTRVRERVEQRFPDDLERIRAYLRTPSVSATGDGIRETAARTVAWVQDAGGHAELVETGGHPLVLGELPGPPGAPRLLRYGMYDVQPAEEPDWTSPPFAAELRELPGVGPAIVGRGSANSRAAWPPSSSPWRCCASWTRCRSASRWRSRARRSWAVPTSPTRSRRTPASWPPRPPSTLT